MNLSISGHGHQGHGHGHETHDQGHTVAHGHGSHGGKGND